MRTSAWRATVAGVLTFAFAALLHSSAAADARSDYLVRLLQSSTQFRVRAQAAISLGRVPGEPSIVTSLMGALTDEHPAVRAAAASSLERLGDPRALVALRKTMNDAQADVRAAAQSAIATLEQAQRPPQRSVAATTTTQPVVEPPVETGPAEYYVGVGLPGSRVSGVDDATLQQAQEFLRAQLRSSRGVVLAPQDEKPKQADAVIRARRLTGYFIDSSIVSVEQRPDGAIRAAVSVVVGTYPGRDMRSILQGAATVMGGGAGARTQAIEAAFTGALRNLGQAMAAGRR